MNCASASYRKFLFWGIFIFVAACFCFIYAVFPVANDDWWVLEQIRYDGVKEMFRQRFFEDNTRIGNFIAIGFTAWLPRWIPIAFSCISVVMTMWIMIRLCGFNQSQWKALSVLIFLFWVAPMWENNLFSAIYAFNYIVPLPFFLYLIKLYSDPARQKQWVEISVALLVGLWHESLAIAFIGGVAVDFLFNRKDFTRRRLMIVLCVAVGILWIILTPAIYARSGRHSFHLTNLHLLFYCWIYFIFIILWIYTFFKGNRKLAHSPLMMFTLGSGILLALVIFTAIPRAMMPGIILSCCSTTVLLRDIFKGKAMLSKRIICSLLMSFTATSLVAVCFETVIIRRVVNFMAEQFYYADIDQKYAFGPTRYPWDAPAITMRRPGKDLFVDGKANTGFLSAYTRRVLMIVPEELRNYKLGSGDRINAEKDIRIWNGHIVSPNPTDSAFKHAHVRYKNYFREEYAAVQSVAFRTDNGDEFTYILPIRSTISTYFGEPTSIELLE